MAKLSVNKELCIGCGLCYSSCPECFECDEEGKSIVKNETCEDCGCNPKEIAENCPTGAIDYE